MLSFISFTAFATVLSLIFENATHTGARRSGGHDSKIENSYIVKLKSGANTTSHINSLPFLFSVEDANSPVTHWWPDNFFKGYSGIFVGAALDAILASPDVDYVEKNSIVSTAEVDFQLHAGWNLQAISTRVPVGSTDSLAMIYEYWYDEPAGEGVDIYIVDTGVYTEHNEFEGRATWGWAASDLAKVDHDGHGTHIAGVAAGKTYGVAKNANIISVKVLDDNGNGSVADIMNGLDWVLANVASNRKPSIVTLAYGDEIEKALDDTAIALVASGITVVVAAGNHAQDARNFSPARVPEVLTVGASNITNGMASFSNFGLAVDISAPGVDITSAGISGPRSTKVASGTSMAAAHVAGIAAGFLSMDPSMTPLEISTRIWSLATQGVISGLPAGMVNALAFNGVFEE